MTGEADDKRATMKPELDPARNLPVAGGVGAKSEIAKLPHALDSTVSKSMRMAAVAGGVTDDRGNPTEQECNAARAASERLRERPPALLVTRPTGGGMTGAYDDTAALHSRLHDTFGTNSAPFTIRAIRELEKMTARRGEDRDPDCTDLNADLAVVTSVAPTNELEAMLAVQMAGTHTMACEMTARALRSDDIEHMNTYLNAATKAQRTFTAQLEALARLRGKGQQTVRVEHVTVESGAQAIVGDVHHHGQLKDRRNAPALQSRRKQALPSPNQIRQTVPGASDEERPVSHARRTKHRSATRKPERP